MTLIVVDQFRTTADSYAIEVDSSGRETVHDGFPKIIRMAGTVSHQGLLSFTTVAYCGSAVTFLPLWEKIDAQMERIGTLTKDDLVRLCDGFHGDYVQLIFPFPNGVLTVVAGEQEPAHVEWYEGAVHAFGSAYESVVNEYRSWYSIFFDALERQAIPGPDIHFMAHQNVYNREGPKKDSLKSEREAKKVRRRFPWGNRK